MFKYTKVQMFEIANKNNFITNSAEKVMRLIDVLDYISKSPINDVLALKGGTAINLSLLNLPRLSVDIDFDFSIDCSREEMEGYRELINKTITSFMLDEGYSLSNRSKFHHSLDSYVYQYNTLSDSRDVLKIEINYLDRCHILNPITVFSSILGRNIRIRRLDNNELIGSKINALLLRTTPRDIFDVYMLKRNKYIDDVEMIKDIALFYVSLGNEGSIVFEDILTEACNKISNFNYNKARETLIPMLHKGEKINIEEIVSEVNDLVRNMFVLKDNEKEYLKEFNSKRFNPELLFGKEYSKRIINHPMALWKMRNE